MPTILKVISLTGVCSSLVVVVPCFVGVDVLGGSINIGQGNVDIISNIIQLL